MYTIRLNRIVIWKKNNNSYYYRIYHHCFLKYDVGYHNSYGHEVVLIIDDFQEKNYRPRRHVLSRNCKRKLINAINKL